jgi:hypothetical protein
MYHGIGLKVLFEIFLYQQVKVRTSHSLSKKSEKQPE